MDVLTSRTGPPVGQNWVRLILLPLSLSLSGRCLRESWRVKGGREKWRLQNGRYVLLLLCRSLLQERGTKVLQFDVCCEATDQNFDCGCILKKGYANLYLLASPNQKLQYRKFGITAALEQLKNMHIAWTTIIIPQDMAFQS